MGDPPAQPSGGDEDVLVAVAGHIGEGERVPIAELELEPPIVGRDGVGADLDLAGRHRARARVGEVEEDRQVGEPVRGHRHLAAGLQREIEEGAPVAVPAQCGVGAHLRADRHVLGHQLQLAGRGQAGRGDVQPSGLAGVVGRPDVDARLGDVIGRPQQVESREAGVGTDAELVDLVVKRAAPVVAEKHRRELVVGREDVLPAVVVGVGDADVEESLPRQLRPDRRAHPRVGSERVRGGQRRDRQRRTKRDPPHPIQD